ncbi:acyl-CoA dehydrogenase family protein [Geodermatophilus sabuli]|uniref:Acyl-CoA dehydrogenase n=1 Tax=Geodermatophilus sabuli TaxID=1564158 RepID=A0A285EDA1_9ACTN|nr:acyl-CoA dehydrogenase family protein [Geodermatophilus sabuli]MBB3085547.1 alkylation response protein AidB-like acyl-CoA dehydrogenase [Geodermatophilus sabuli]SNX96031.1 Acyl-CoA dehydrogenase [Geodermatophilus sabuli]
MDFLTLSPVAFPEPLVELRHQVRAFLRDEITEGRITPHCDQWLAGWDPGFSRRLAERGWLGMAFPTEYGGSAAGALARFVVTEELLAAGAPVAAHWIADRQSGQALMKFGTEEQRKAFLPRIARGECFFAIGMSEPDTGSDLASVRTRGTRVDGGWVLNGTKLWTSGAHHAHAMIALIRTEELGESRHAGLTQVIVELPDPAVEVRPIRLLTGEHHFNEVVFQDTFVPDSRVLGKPGAGWKQVTSELALERSGPERILSTFPLLVVALRTIAEDGVDVDRARLGELVARLWALRRMSIAVAGRLEQGEDPATAAAIVKDLGTQFEGGLIDVVRMMVGIEPDLGSLYRLPRMLAEAVLHSPGFTLRGGTNEILRGIVAKAVGAS